TRARLRGEQPGSSLRPERLRPGPHSSHLRLLRCGRIRPGGGWRAESCLDRLAGAGLDWPEGCFIEMTRAVRSVGIVGGGTAGYLAALSLRRRFPEMGIEVITAPDIPPIGVGESTIFQIVDFLHGHLGID